MTDILVTSPYRPFTLPTQFKAVFNGYIYCGTVDAVDPSVSQVQVYLVNEDGDKVPVAQPLRTNAGGFLVYNGQPAKFVTDSNHSLLVRDSLGVQVWYAPDISSIDPDAIAAILGSQTREALRRSYAEAGYAMVAGSFEKSATVTSKNQVVLFESEGKGYSWGGPLPKSVPVGSSPAGSGGISPSAWIDQSSNLRNSSLRIVVAPNDGVTDATELLQAGFNPAGAMFVPEGVYMVKAHTDSGGYGGILVRDNSFIIFHPKAVFKAITNDKPAYAILNFEGASNVTVIEPTLVGDNDTHIGTAGEFGMGLFFRNSNNIYIARPKISKCWGDGIYVGQIGSVGACTDVVIDDPVIDSCRRQGVSIISADGLTINNPVISNIRGTLPSAGIDIEPNNADCVLSRIKINNLKTTNTVSGLWIDLRVFTDGVATKTVDIEVNGHNDEGSDTGATFTRNIHQTYGSIKYKTPILRNSKDNGIQVRRWDSQGVNIEIDNPVVINPNRRGSSTVLTGAGISCYTLDTDASPTTGSGNVTIINPRVIFEPGVTPAFPTQIAFRDSKSLNVDRVKILGMVDNPATFLELLTGVNESTCEITTSKNVRYKGRISSVGQQNFGFMGKFSGSVDTTGLVSTAVVKLGSLGSQWHHAVIRVGVMCCAATSGTPAANSIGYSESIITFRHKVGSAPIGTDKKDIVANINSVISVAYFDSPPRVEVYVTMLAAGNRVGWDVEAGGTAGSPLSISIS